MADLDLKSALEMFSTGMKEFAFTRALSGANEAVQNIKSSLLDETEKRTQLQDVSNQLVTHMAGMGIPATTMQAVAGAIGPKQYGNSSQMAADAIRTGNQDLLSQANQLQGFEQNPAYKMELLQAKNANSNPLAKARFTNEQDEFNTKQQQNFLKQTDSTQASSRTAFGMGAKAIQQAARLDEIVGDPAHYKDKILGDTALISDGLIQLSKGASATKEELEALLPNTRGTWEARVKQYITNNPEPAKVEGFIKHYKELIDRETNANKLSTIDTMLARANAFTGHAKKDESYANEMKLTLASSLSNLGTQVSPEDIQFDPKKGFTIGKYEELKNKANENVKTMKEAYGYLNSPNSSPELAAKAAKLLSHYGLTPQTPIKQAAEIVTKRTRLGMFQ